MALPTAEALTDEWVQELIAATAELASTEAPSTPVALTIGKKRGAVLVLEGGRVVGGSAGLEGEAVELTVPTTAEQLEQFLDGTDSMARAYMRGDIKPVGPTGQLLYLVEIFEALGS